MQVFISWSGDRSRAVAELLRTWLKDVLQAITPWMSDEDIEKGAVWFDVINAALAESGFGIICLTAEKQHAPWLLFEAGALAKGLDKSRVCPLCVDLEKTQVTGPLSLLNLAEASIEKDMRQLVKSINAQIPADRGQLDDAALDRSFKRLWPEFRDKLKTILEQYPAMAPVKRSREDIAEETLSLVRAQSDRLAVIERATRPIPSQEELFAEYIRQYGSSPSGSAGIAGIPVQTSLGDTAIRKVIRQILGDPPWPTVHKDLTKPIAGDAKKDDENEKKK